MSENENAGNPISTLEYFTQKSPKSPAPKVVFRFSSEALLEGDWRVAGAHVREAISELYSATIDLVSADAMPSLDALLGAPCDLELVRGPRVRRVCGVVRRVQRVGTRAGMRLVRVEIVPALWLLSQRVTRRIFQDVTVLEVVRAVLHAAGLYADTLAVEVHRTFAKREYCVQHQESDLAFVSRLLESVGVAYYFRHDGATETWVLTDEPTWKLSATLDHRPVPYMPPQAELAPVETVHALVAQQELRPTGAIARDYDFTHPSAVQTMTRTAPANKDPGARALYEFGRVTFAGYQDATQSYSANNVARRAEVAYLAGRTTETLARGEGDVTGFTPGLAFELVGHEFADLDQRYVVTRIEHFLDAPEELLSTATAAALPPGPEQLRYRNEFECIAASVPFVPALNTPLPVITGAQTAFVVGPAGEEIFCDPHGRIRVKFQWDLAKVSNEQSSAWVRVAQAWAGAGFGTLFIPRVGMEVVVHFLEGDPDRPIVTGCVYNGESPAPEVLPQERARSVIRTRSTPGGAGHNELRFDDKAGEENVLLHAHGSLTESVNGARTSTVGGNDLSKVGQCYGVDVKQTAQLASQSEVLIVGESLVGVGAGALRAPPTRVVMSPTELGLTAPDTIVLSAGGASIIIGGGKVRLLGTPTAVPDAPSSLGTVMSKGGGT